MSIIREQQEADQQAYRLTRQASLTIETLLRSRTDLPPDLRSELVSALRDLESVSRLTARRALVAGHW